ncbi:DUF4957 domain-containing protein [Sphingobacterium faecium]|jgi:hypothetical protein|uniref:DUF4957 domain-containing protein n=1 Tax=Sphingobacterium faecium TaxID=34087 RepID=UPI0004E5F9F6|nr:DUF4957 domain-containing protein [Sphingobacterium faecium]WGQ16675.1 DUF4957 domain-containing protein [Sphingobacterium faecium]CDS92386.1 Fibronectin type III domain protein [Sphingobacterium sp. PM2-P1-29]SJN33688.1 hypothetical protein FM120_08775 [Sphingobacterium faecium PCAi_F2.5]HCU45065.1 DUF4957 domain-containing protein [Sphingobacterium sp.]
MIKFNNFIYPFILIISLGTSGCKDDRFAEITTLDVDRVFSPTSLETRVVNQTGVRLTWKAVSKATSYTVEVYASKDESFSGEPKRVVSDILFDQVPYTITGLSGDTDYAVRVKAVGVDIKDSKWSSATFKTSTEQIFKAVDVSKIEANAAFLEWTAGEKATTIVLSPGNIIHQVTADEIAKGQATVSGLIGETNYVATLMNESKVRGTLSFTTAIDLGGAILITTAAELESAIKNAVGGETFALKSGEYLLSTDLLISKVISIKGIESVNKPVLINAGFIVSDGAALSIKDLILDGKKEVASTFIYKQFANGTYGDLHVQDVVIRNYKNSLLNVADKSLINAVQFEQGIFHNIEGTGGDFIDIRKGLVKGLTFVNNTVYNCVAARDLFRMDADGSTNFPSENVILKVSNNTFYNVVNLNTKRLFYVRVTKNEISFTKNIVVNTDGLLANQAATTLKTVAKNNYFNAVNFTATSSASIKIDPSGTTLNPGFKDVSNGDFTISNSTLKENGIGDMRWIK